MPVHGAENSLSAHRHAPSEDIMGLYRLSWCGAGAENTPAARCTGFSAEIDGDEMLGVFVQHQQGHMLAGFRHQVAQLLDRRDGHAIA